MDLSAIPLFSAITRKMGWLTHRQEVLAENVANVDTPGYRASDLRPLDFRAELAAAADKHHDLAPAPQLTLASTESGHMSGSLDATNFQAVADNSEDRQINGNTVSIEDEMMKVSQNAADYQLMTNLYKKQVDMMTTAIDRGA